MRKPYLVRALTRTQTTRFLCSSPSPPSPAHVALNNVTKSNFEPALAQLRRHVREADFVSIDLEMTGITSAPWRESFHFDRSDIQYLKTKDSAQKFAVVQFGVCPFRWDASTNSFVAHPHNFYIFPCQEIPGRGLSNEFLCQTSSLEFLAKYQFDFNACIHEGISYLSRSQEEEALGLLESKHKDFHDASFDLGNYVDIQLVRMSDILFTERMKVMLTEWRDGLLRNKNLESKCQVHPNNVDNKFMTTFFLMRPALVLNGLTSHQIRLIKLVTGKHFSDLAYVHVTVEDSGPRKPLIVYTESRTDRDLLMREVKSCQMNEAEMKIKSEIGFRHVIDLLSSERKLIVGHNCFLDIAHVYSKFIGPLPCTAEEFARAVQSYFPHIIDTKLLLNANDELFSLMKRGGTSLSKAFSLLCTMGGSVLAHKPRVKVEVQVDNQRFSNWNSGAKHEAGYDAFMTGCIFSQACSHLGIDFNYNATATDLLHNEKLQKYINHLYLSWMNGDIIDLKTGKAAAESFGSTKHRHLKIVYSNTILLWGLPSTLKGKDIRDCFFKVYGRSSIISIYHLDETAAFIQFSKPELVSNLLDLKDALEKDNNKPVSVLHPLSEIFEGGCVHAATYEMYKEICSSPKSEVLFSDQAEGVKIKLKLRAKRSGTEVEKQENKIFEKDSPKCALHDREDKVTISRTDVSRSPDELIDSFYSSEAQMSK